MKTSILRNHWVRVGAVSVAVIAGWHLVVSPTIERLRVRQALAEGLTQAIDHRQAAIDALPEHPETALERTARAAAAYEAFWAESSDTAGLYDRMTELAAETGVQIERIEPRRTSSAGRRPSGEAIAFEPTGYRIDVLGDLQTIARFTGAVQRRTGLSVVDSLRIVPSGAASDEMSLRASLRTSHYRIVGGLDSRGDASGGTP